MNNKNIESFDPTITSFLDAPSDQICYTKSWIDTDGTIKGDPNKEIFISLLCKGILNVSQVVRKDIFNVISIPINSDFITEKLSFQEILSDIVLYQLITGDIDRLLLATNCNRTKTVGFHNCEIFKFGSYSIFDICDKEPRINKEEVLDLIFENIRNLYDNQFLDDIETIDGLFTAPTESSYINFGKESFFERMLSKINDFLEMYDNVEGKELFLNQKIRSREIKGYLYTDIYEKDDFLQEDNKRYIDLIFSLKSIKEVISDEDINNKAINYLTGDFDFLKKELKKYFSKYLELSKQLDSIIKKRSN